MMVDPFTLATGLAGLVSLAIELVEIVSTYTAAVRDAPKAAQDLCEGLIALNHVLDQLVKFLRTEDAKGSAFDQTSVLCATTNLCRTSLQSLLRKVKELNEGGKVVRAAKRLKWPFSDEEIQRLVDTVRGCTQTFQLSLTIEGCALLSKTADDVTVILNSQMDMLQQMAKMSKMFSTLNKAAQEATSSQISEILRLVAAFKSSSDDIQGISMDLRSMKIQAQDHKRVRILDWLSSFQSDQKHQGVRSQRQGDTGHWLLQTEQFQLWRSDPASPYALWCHGIPGATKTVITSLVIDHLSNYFVTQNVGIAYFYCDYRDQELQSPADIVASLLRQLLVHSAILPDRLCEMYEQSRRDRKHPKLDEFRDVLSSVCQGLDRAYIIIDALDECHATRHRKSLLRVLQDLKNPSTKLFVASRSYPDDINRMLVDYPQIIIQASDSDIRKFLLGRIEQDDDIIDLIDDALKEEIIVALTAAARGMFLLPALQIQTVLDQTTRSEIRQSLKSLPTELNTVFEETLKRIQSQPRSRMELGMKTLMWTSLAKRPLRIEEIRHALAVRLDDSHLDRDNLPIQRYLVESCSGLVTVDVESSTIRIVHLSLQEYFQTRAQDLFPDGVKTIAEVCLTYLSFERFAPDDHMNYEKITAIKNSFPLLEYAAQNWGFHVRESPMSEVMQLTFDFLSQQSNWQFSAQFLSFDDEDQLGEIRHPRHLAPLHLAARFGLLEIVERLSADANFDVDCMDEAGRTPLSYAAQYGHEVVARFLVEECYADVDLFGPNQYSSPLTWATRNGYVAIVTFLLGKDAALEHGYTDELALRVAVQAANETITRLLIEQGADINAAQTYHGTALMEAADNGNEGLVRLLLQNGADVHVQISDGDACTALEAAAFSGHRVIVRLLLQNGADVNAQNDGFHGNALAAAAYNGQLATVRELLDNGADPNRLDLRGYNALHSAVVQERVKVVQLLLEKGANINITHPKGMTLLSLAPTSNQEMIHLLESWYDQVHEQPPDNVKSPERATD